MKTRNILLLGTFVFLVIQGCGGMEKESDALVRQELSEAPDPAELLMNQARALEDEGNYKEACRLYGELADDYSDSFFLPEAMFRNGKCLEGEEKFYDAIDLYEDLIDYYPDSDFAPDAQFRIGICLQEEGELLNAFDAYQKLFDEYPGKGSLDEILKREYAIGKVFMDGRKRLFIFFRIRSGLGTAEDIFRAILKNATFSKVSTRAQYSLGWVLQMQGDYKDAILEYNQVLTNYPGTKEIPLALFNIGVCYYEEALSSDYDAGEVNKALQNFTRFTRNFPDDPNRTEAEEKISELIDKKAEKSYAIANYYNSPDSFAGARIYYQEVIDKYPESRYARMAEKKLAKLPDPAAGDQQDD